MPSKWYNEDINTFNLFIENWIKYDERAFN